MADARTDLDREACRRELARLKVKYPIRTFVQATMDVFRAEARDIEATHGTTWAVEQLDEIAEGLEVLAADMEEVDGE
jgi:hypothetical protein